MSDVHSYKGRLEIQSDGVGGVAGFTELTLIGSARCNMTRSYANAPRRGTEFKTGKTGQIEATITAAITWDDADTYDSDTNGILNRAEYIAGTAPTDPDSYLRIIDLNISTSPTNWTTQLTWHGAKGGATNTTWQLYATTNGITASSWSAVTGGTWSITGTGTNTWTQEIAPPATPHFLRIHAIAQ